MTAQELLVEFRGTAIVIFVGGAIAGLVYGNVLNDRAA